MARIFANATTDIIDFASSVPDLTSNWTISAWVRRTGTGGDTFAKAIWSRWTNSTTNRQLFVYFNPDSSAAPNKIQVDVPWVSAVLTGSTAITDTNWHHVAVKRSGTSWTLYLDGAVDGTATDGSTQETGGSVQLGGSTASSSTSLYGSEAEVGAWNVALDASEIAALSKGFSPLFVRPSACVFYSTLNGNGSAEQDVISGASGTVTGATRSSHSYVIYPRHKTVVVPTVAAGGTSVAVFDHHYRMMRAG